MKSVLGLMAGAVILLFGAAEARAGRLHGHVKDEQTGEAIIGANIRVFGTNFGTTTDLDGRYEIVGVPAGTYDVRVFYGGYAAKVVTGVIVTDDGGESIKLDMKLEPLGDDATDGATRLEDTYVTAERIRSTWAAILSERQKSAVIGDGISADQIAKSPDATSGDALKRVTGISVVDNKYVYVRGVTDRYNATTLNGVMVSSTDTKVDKKSFSFDLVPSELLSNTVVIKTATPDLQGDFAGGLVQLNTLDFPSRRIVAVKMGIGSTDLSTSEPKLLAARGSTDWYGKDDGTRARPEAATGSELIAKLANNWSMGDAVTPYNGNLGFSLGNRHSMGGDREFGYVGSVVYKRGFRTEEYYQDPGEFADSRTENGVRYKSKVLWGTLLDLNAKPWVDHKFSFKNNFSRSADENLSEANGDLRGEGAEGFEQTIEWTERWLYVGQVAGDHTWDGLGKTNLNWRVFYNESEASEPDRKYVRYQADAFDRQVMRENHRSWSDLQENWRGGQADVTFPIFSNGKLKGGYFQSEREREFGIEDWITDQNRVPGARPPFNQGLTILPIDTIFDPANYMEPDAPRQPGNWKFVSFGDFTGKYDAAHELSAYYGMADLPFSVFGQRMRITGGVRVEDSYQVVNSTNPDGTESAGDATVQAVVDRKDPLPSANFVYQLTRSSNIRLAYAKSVNRPEFRELSPVKYYDFNRERNVQGNPGLDRAEIDSYDIRVEWFPDINEVVSASVFRKDITNAIEERLLPAPDRFVQTWENAGAGENFGWEVEARKSLSFLGDWGTGFMLMANYTRVESEIEYIDYERPAPDAPFEPVTKTRPLQGQAPWMFNGSFMYTAPRIGFNINFLYNQSGRRLDAVGETREEDVYEESRSKFDIAITQQITDWTRLKFAVRDIAAKDQIFTIGDGQEIDEARRIGTSYSISLSFNL